MEANLFLLESEVRCKTLAQRVFFKRVFFRFCLRGLSLFLDKKLDKLDPHVGDTACQIRACQLIFLSIDNAENHKKNYYESFRDKLRKDLQQLKREQFFSLAVLPEEIFFFGLCYFLTVFRVPDEVGGSKAMDFRRVAKFLSISNTWTRDIIRVSQKELSKSSCDFIFMLSLKIKYPYHHLLEIFLMQGDDGRALLPCFFSSDVIWRYLKQEKIPICFEIGNKFFPKQIKVFFNKGSFNRKPCFYLVCDSVGLNLEEIYDYSANRWDEIFYANIGNHCQYPGFELKIFSINPFASLRQTDRRIYKSIESAFCHYLGRSEMLSICAIRHVKTKWMDVSRVFSDELKEVEQNSRLVS